MVDSSGTRYGASVVLMNPMVRNGLYELGKVLFGSFKIKCDKMCIKPEFCITLQVEKTNLVPGVQPYHHYHPEK